MFRPGNDRRGGMVAVLMVLCMVPMVIGLGVVLDAGILMSERRHSQAIADSVARAGACLLAKNYPTDSGLDPKGTARAAALAMAVKNGYTEEGARIYVTINIPPQSNAPPLKSSAFAGVAGCVEAVITYSLPRSFTGMLGGSNFTITSRAVARATYYTPSSVLLTNKSIAGALTLTGGARLTTSGPILVNSSSPGAVNASNGAYATDNGGIGIVGGYSIPNWATPATFFSKAPMTGRASMDDPYATMVAPSASGLTSQNAPNPPYGSATINPGVYTGGLTLGGGMTISMNPGIYYMKGGGFNVANGVNLTDNGSGVMIYMDSGGGSISLQGGTTVSLTPPTTGPYKGVVYFQDKGNTSSLNNIANGANVSMKGAFYAPNAALKIAGGATGSIYGSQLVVNSLNLSNGVNISIKTDQGSGNVTFLNLVE